MKNPLTVKSIGLLLSLMVLSGCSTTNIVNCNLPCQLDISQETDITVENFANVLSNEMWITDNIAEHFKVTYESDSFSSVLETKVNIQLSDNAPRPYQPAIVLYIGNIGGADPDYSDMPSELIESIQVESDLNVFQTLLQYGLPQGGRIFPIYIEGDLGESNPCPQRSHYIAYYNGGRQIIRATVEQPLFINLWTADVEILYPFGDTLAWNSTWIGKYERMDHRSCLPN